MTRFKKVIGEYFDWDFFWRPFKSSKQIRLDEHGERFLANHPDLFKKVITDFRSNFPQSEILGFSPFPVEDRCLSFEIKSNTEGTFVICISIFKYFLVWKFYDGEPYTPENYIETGESELIDRIYQLVIKPHVEVEWLNRAEAFMEVKELNYASASGPFKDEEEDFETPIFLANLLTRFR
ncbi:hypothetical protein D3C87_1424760 [compost metagenome]